MVEAGKKSKENLKFTWIEVRQQTFLLKTRNTSYLMVANKFGHLEQIHYGEKVLIDDLEALRYKHTIPYGSAIIYQESESSYSLDNLLLNWSGTGRGDYRESPLELEFADGSQTSDFKYQSYQLIQGTYSCPDLPTAQGNPAESLILEFKEASRPLSLKLIFTVFPDQDVICRRAILENLGQEDVSIYKFMSCMLDLPKNDYVLLHLAGDWNAECQVCKEKLGSARLVISSSTGSSSNRANPAWALAESGANQDHGQVIGCNLIYSGNHYSSISRSNHDLVRLVTGISPENFHWNLKAGQEFTTPEAVISFSKQGYNGLAQNMHGFVKNHIIPGYWQEKPRPIVLNSWEAYHFKFTESSILKLAKEASKLGIELFVLDDGWFGQRNDDKAGLGDYDVNRKKLPGGLKTLAEKLQKLDLDFGLWFEPEAVNPDSKLYRSHPEYAIKPPDRDPVLGRNQLLLDLTREDVQDYIVAEITKILDSAPIRYVKWDMNRHLADLFSQTCRSGEFVHRYYLALYKILHRIFDSRPEILLEMCSSGGNRFDLGMLAFAPQIWASDNTDPIDRLAIQEGLSYFYPQSAISCHVSAAPHSSTLRKTRLSTRFNIAAFGVLGYELDLGKLNKLEKASIKEQILFYKEYREIFQQGRFFRYDLPAQNQTSWSVVSPDSSRALVVLAQGQSKAGPSADWLKVKGLDPGKLYRLDNFKQKLSVSEFGSLLDYVLPVSLRADGLILTLANRYYALDDGMLSLKASGSALASGICLESQFIGTGYQPELRMWGDYGSQIYIINQLKGDDNKGEDNAR